MRSPAQMFPCQSAGLISEPRVCVSHRSKFLRYVAESLPLPIRYALKGLKLVIVVKTAHAGTLKPSRF